SRGHRASPSCDKAERNIELDARLRLQGGAVALAFASWKQLVDSSGNSLSITLPGILDCYLSCRIPHRRQPITVRTHCPEAFYPGIHVAGGNYRTTIVR